MLSIKLSATIHYSTASSSSCQVYPSEYAYRDDSVARAESASANCSSYPPREDYIHCDGTQLKLADSNIGQEPYRSSDYYQWSAGSAGKLLFIFPTNISLTTITLHYYSDSVRGRPRLRFYAVPDDFDIWDALTSDPTYVGIGSVPAGGESAGRRSVHIGVNFNTSKVLMYKFSSRFRLAVSEVEFFKLCASTSTSKYLYTDCCILPSYNDLRLLNMYSG